ncbi:hypothetical protein KGF56_002047 [Candida oxycetoniae]|uniref:Major facilitator superfamily (MFS) profile domain-containing protein n=1 Tax=Candida oxycetoniae TaxID=497107 RepID=A0AAI9WYQ5_9ASCO|nr:uncharacterized protein KGF56_002047 [Candida oxycetoniae]KAI3405091.2 hypothetical protein KGF56_002047 [Candida oxycetoniae]
MESTSRSNSSESIKLVDQSKNNKEQESSLASEDANDDILQSYHGSASDLEVNAIKREEALYDNALDQYNPDLIALGSNALLSRQISRIITNTESRKSGKAWAEKSGTIFLLGEGRELPPDLPDRSAFIVSYNGKDDTDHPHNYSLWTKIMYSFCVGLAALSVSMGSAMFSAGDTEIMHIFHIGVSVAALGTSLFVLGFAAGPVIHGPLSELLGRKVVMIISCLGYVCFSFGVATGKDIQTVMICRFFAGFVGSAPFVVAPAVMVDLFNAKHRGVAIAVFSCTLFGGPMFAPILGGFTVKNSALGWRWTSYFSAIIGCVALVLNTFVLKETYHPFLLVRKAELLRRKTGNWGIFAPHEEVTLSFSEIVRNNVARPLKLLITEPIILLVSLYNAFIYGMLYMFLTAIPIIYSGGYGWSQGVAELPYISMFLGIISGCALIVWFEFYTNKKIEAHGHKPVPEDRLPPVMVGGFTFVIGIFWLGWSGDYPKQVHWIVPTIGAFFIGNGLISIFLPTMNYIIDCYLFIAASALAGNAFIRSAFASAFPLFSTQMFTNLTVKWASTLIGCLAVLMFPIPFLFYKYGATIRQKSTHALH